MPVPMPTMYAIALILGPGIAQSPPPSPSLPLPNHAPCAHLDTTHPTSVGASLALRVAALFVILASVTLGALLPVLGARTGTHALPRAVLDVARYFGSGQE
ncbi:hypothetical protein DFH09DRAFT_1305572 [Mycena vulgaris]|nr:hypothetical protein DFH09DRAFT_1305572 [Mycena vulgaris]